MCPLCLSLESELFDQDKQRSFYKCVHCELVFVDRKVLISESLEKDRYESHENSEEDIGYKNYLSKIASSIKPYLFLDAKGLDFGCGKTKMLAELLKPLSVVSYDVYFHPEGNLLQEKFDFIILSEVIEHLRTPRETMLMLNACLKPNGKLFIKTKLRPESYEDFSKWFYKRDITHIQFFNGQSFSELADLCQLNSPIEIGEDLFLFRND
jgi:SAM-dependent methyltransferase